MLNKTSPRRWCWQMQRQCIWVDVHIFWTCLLKLLPVVLGECRYISLCIWRTIFLGVWLCLCYPVPLMVSCCDYSCCALKEIFLLLSCRVCGYRCLSVWIPLSMNMCVWLPFPYINAGEMALVLLAHCVCRWCVHFSPWKLWCTCEQRVPGASAAVAWLGCGCRCYIWQCLGSCHPLCPSEAEGSSPSGCWRRNGRVSFTQFCTATQHQKKASLIHTLRCNLP